MCSPNSHLEERRLSLNGLNAYISIMSAENNCQNKQKNIFDPKNNKNYLTIKPSVKKCSCFPSSVPKNNEGCQCFPTATADQFSVSPQSMQNKTKSSMYSTPEKNIACNKSPNGAITKNMSVDCIKSPVQAGMDRYFTITKKRKASPHKGKSPKITKKINNKQPSDLLQTDSNRFSILDTENSDTQNVSEGSRATSNAKPPPIFLREAISSTLVKSLTDVAGHNNFYVVSHSTGKIKETKIQIYSEKIYRVVQNYLESQKKNFYTYQLKSSKGLVVVIKGIESSVDPTEIKEALQVNGFETKMVMNILNKNRVPQPMFKVELAPNAPKLKRNETHPIYKLRYLLHRRVQVEEPHKRNGPVQCTNCQEFGHTKSYCTLRTVCVACGDFHQVSQCKLDKLRKEDKEKIKCGNCGDNHTANYRGCPVYIELKKRLNQNRQNMRNQPYISHTLPKENAIFNPVTPGISYANASRTDPIQLQNQPMPQKIQNTNSSNTNVGLESTLNAFLQSMNAIMAKLQNTLQDLSQTQGQMLQILLAKK